MASAITITRCKSVVLNGVINNEAEEVGFQITDSNVSMYNVESETATAYDLAVSGDSRVSMEDCTFTGNAGANIIEDSAIVYVVGTGNTYDDFTTSENGQEIAVDR